MEIEKQITLINETIKLLQYRVSDMLIDPSIDGVYLAAMNDCIDRLMLTAGELLCSAGWIAEDVHHFYEQREIKNISVMKKY